MTNRQKMLIILVDESDTWGEHALYEGITRKLEHLEAPGATVQAGIMGFGSHHKIHRKRAIRGVRRPADFHFRGSRGNLAAR